MDTQKKLKECGYKVLAIWLLGFIPTWQSDRFSKNIKFNVPVIAGLFLIWMLTLGSLKPNVKTANQQTVKTEKALRVIVDIPNRIQNLLNNSTLHIDQNMPPYKIAYNLELSQKDILALSPHDADDLLRSIYKNNSSKNYKRAWIFLHATFVDDAFAILSMEDGNIKVNTDNLTRYQCGLKQSDMNRTEVQQKVRWLRTQVSELAIDFINKYESGVETKECAAKAQTIMEEWESFIGKMWPGHECAYLLIRPESTVKNKAISALSTIQSSHFITPSDIGTIRKNLESMMFYKI